MDPGTFDRLGLDPSLLRAVRALGYEKPTPIQESAIPAVLAGRDVIGTAQTGSGKTAAFLLPILHRLLAQPPGRTRVLVLAPTRELAAQIEEALRSFAKGTRVRGVAVYGGVGYGAQEDGLRRGADVVVATPGRLLDHLERRNVDFRDLQVLVLDEADRMLDMGFLPDVRRVIHQVPRNRQTLLFSATMPAAIVDLSRAILHDPVRLSVSPPNRPPDTIRHEAYPVAQHLKTSLLNRLLGREDMLSVLVFVRTKRRADRVARQVAQANFAAGRIHGDRSQNQREEALEAFRKGRFQVLVATDVAARGIDVAGITHVINYDVPVVPEDYVHRIGRTARAEAQGEAITLMAPEEAQDFHAIEKVLGRPIPIVTLPDFDYRAPPPPRSAGGAPRGRGGGRGGSRPPPYRGRRQSSRGRSGGRPFYSGR
jgi:ATP-dependent RNA helicase RhlE